MDFGWDLVGEFDEKFMECDGNVMDSGWSWWEW